MGYNNSAKKKITSQVAFIGGVESRTMTGAETWDEKSSNWARLDPGGANRNITLPAEETNDGLWFGIINSADAAENLVILDDAGATIITLNRGEAAVVGCSGSAWIVVQQTAAAFANFGADGILADVVAESTSAAGVTVDGLRIKDAAITPVAGGAAWADLTACATGEADTILAANLADAWTLRTAALTYLTVTSTTATPGVAWTFARTGAGSAESVTNAINSATAAAVGVASVVTQTTTARTAGQVSGFSSTLTSLAGDLNSVVYADYFAAAPTDGGGTVLHVGYKVAAGHDAAFDLSSCATGEGDTILGANLASAYSLRTSALDFLVVSTTTATPGVAWTFTRTDAGAAESVTNAINSATASAQGVASVVAQTTTARTAGYVAGFQSNLTSLAGDLNSVIYADYFAGAPTDGGGTVIHTGFKVAAGHDVALDLSSCATGEADILIADHLASAFEIREAANQYMVVTSTNDAERIRFYKIVADMPTGTIAAPIDMAGAEHTLVLGTAGAAQTKLLGNVVFIDANTGSAPENLVLPAASAMTGVTLKIINVGGEQATVETNKLTLETLEAGFITSDGTSWIGYGVGTVT